MKKHVPTIIITIGVILFCVGLFKQIPSKQLKTYSSSSQYSVIEEYVGGDAYNYIIGAALVGGEIAGAMTQKAVFMSVGALIFCIGLVMLAQWRGNEPDAEKQVTNESKAETD